ncbi:hypothetical protein ACFVW8_33015 [Streptomyces sp. NPDC058221]|uniref:hypothetical protein n=1 Tax=Streptomyces sp. NPDC058221 TaxID=3346388 RepID=UPI0036E4A02A
MTDHITEEATHYRGEGAATLYDENLTPKPAYDAVRTALGGGEGRGPGAPKTRYRNGDGPAAGSRIKPGLQLVNTADSAAGLSSVTARR